MNQSLDILSHNSGATLAECPKRYWWMYERQLQPIKSDASEAMRIGRAMHVGREAYEDDGLEAGLNAVHKWEDAQNALGDGVRRVREEAAKARAMLRASAAVWPRVEGAKAELVVSMPIRNPATGRCSRTFNYAGVVDRLAGGLIDDWKTTGEISGWIRSQTRGFQVECYVLAAANDGIQVTGACYRLIETPGISLCGKDGWGVVPDDAAVESYESRCYDWLMVNGGATHLTNHDVFINAGRLDMARHWLWDTAQEILWRRSTGVWPKNPRACKRKGGGSCPFNDPCDIEDQGGDPEGLIRERYERRERGVKLGKKSDPHPELVQAV